ncbi:UNVERIFIED_CONTAM: hypothetical protein Slati_2679500 [Sesamum latifolium]|uniref:Transposase (putative) gypsy type domain-containing protein n=1 Tax=Sesamum latifolium TaxID=2727402 RepID=A0AAW2VV60_9LAMI
MSWVTAPLRAVTLSMRTTLPISSSLGVSSSSSFPFHLLEPELRTRRSGSPLPSYVAGRRWSLRQATRRLLDESSEEEDASEEEEGSSPGEMDPLPREERVSFGNRGSRPVGSAWVACSLRQSDIYQLVEEFAIPPKFVISLPPPVSHPSPPPPGYMSFFVSQLRAGLRFPIPSFFHEVSHDLLQVPLNHLVPNSIRLLAAFSIVLRYNNLIPTSRLFCQCFQLKRTKPGVFHFAPRRGVSFLPTPSPAKHWKGDFFFILPPLPWNIPHRWIYEFPPSVQVSLADREGWGPRRAADVMKGVLPAGDKRLLSSLSSEDLDHMLTLVLTKAFILRGESLSERQEGQTGPRGGFCEGFGGEGGSLAGGSGRLEGGEKGGRGEVSEGGKGSEETAARGKGPAGGAC